METEIIDGRFVVPQIQEMILVWLSETNVKPEVHPCPHDSSCIKLDLERFSPHHIESSLMEDIPGNSGVVFTPHLGRSVGTLRAICA